MQVSIWNLHWWLSCFRCPPDFVTLTVGASGAGLLDLDYLRRITFVVFEHAWFSRAHCA